MRIGTIAHAADAFRDMFYPADGRATTVVGLVTPKSDWTDGVWDTMVPFGDDRAENFRSLLGWTSTGASNAASSLDSIAVSSDSTLFKSGDSLSVIPVSQLTAVDNLTYKK